MQLEFTLVLGLSVAAVSEGAVVSSGGVFPPVELSASWPDGAPSSGCTGTSLQQVLAANWPDFDFTVDGQAIAELQPGRTPLRNGAVVVAWPVGTAPAFSSQEHPATLAYLCVCAGPSAGTIYPLRRGRYSLGRGPCRLTLPDPALSRHHGTLLVGSRLVTLTVSPGSAGFLMRRRADGPTASAQPVKGPLCLEVGMQLYCGNSVLELRLPGSEPHSRPADLRSPALLDLAATAPIGVPQPAGSARTSLTMLLTGLLPLLLGTALAVFTGSLMFLAFAAMGAATVLVPLFGGARRRRMFRADVAAAVVLETEQTADTFPDAATLVLDAATRTATAGSPVKEAGVRLGTASRRAHVVSEPATQGFNAPMAHDQPVVTPLGESPLTIRGPADAILSLLNFVLMQLDAADVPVALAGSAGLLPCAARFLPHTKVVESAQGAIPDRVLLTVSEQTRAGVVVPSARRGIHFIVEAPDSAPMSAVATNDVQLHADGPGVAASLAGDDFIPDGVPARVFAGYARRRAVASGPASSGNGGTLAPNLIPLEGQCSVPSIVAAWRTSDGGPLLSVPIGSSASGTTLFSFQNDGPHLLVGGTTGSGKSEFLKALVGSLAVSHSPAELQFVFVDFKGGAGLGALGRLPHTNSLVTDLGGHGVGRMLASLRAELHRREAALSASGVADSKSYRALCREEKGSTTTYRMAHLVIVVDEFRVLVDQFPDAMTELMRIAAVGRSLGIHLVMATQRPQGAVNADIRANVTSSICLRVQSNFDSVDVIGTSVAASIAVDTPGRAYISRAGGAPEEFQCAVLGLPPSGTDLLPTLVHLDSNNSTDLVSVSGPVLAGDVDAVSAVVTEAWHAACTMDAGLVAAPAVVAPELPLEIILDGRGGITMDDGFGTGFNGLQPAAETRELSGTVVLGLVDLPEQQCVKALLWNPRDHSHVACVGTVAETSKAVALVAGQVISQSVSTSASAKHTPMVYLLDADGTMAHYAASPCIGSYLGPGDLRTVAHLVNRLAQIATDSPRPLILCITDWGRWSTALRASPWHETEDAISELIRFGGKNITVVMGGDRSLLSANFLAAIPNRIYLSCGSPAESTMLWPRIPHFAPLTGRAAIDGPINNLPVQAAEAAAVESMHVAQLGTAVWQATEPGGKHRDHSERADFPSDALRVRPLPRSLSKEQFSQLAPLASPSQAGTGRILTLLLGVGGDGRAPVHVRLQPGTVLAIVGGPQSGKSSFLRALAQFNDAQWLEKLSVSSAQQSDNAIRLLDDPHSCTPEKLQQATELLTAGDALVVAVSYPGPAVSRLPLEWGLRTARQGIVVRPQQATDAELFGVRLDTVGSEPPGRAVLIDGNRREWFHFPSDGI